MGDMAAVLCLISFAVLGLGNSVISGEVNLSASNGTADQVPATVSSALSSLTTGNLSVEQLPVVAESEGAKETTPAMSDVATPKLIDSPQISSSPDHALLTSSTTEKTEPSAVPASISLTIPSSVDKSLSTLPTDDALPSIGTGLDPTAPILDETPNQEKPSETNVVVVSVTTEKQVSTKENVTLELTTLFDARQSTTEETQNKPNAEVVTEMHVFRQGNEKLPPPIIASLVRKENSENGTFNTESGSENGANISGSDHENNASVDVELAPTELHILTQEAEKLAPPTISSLVGDGKSILSISDTSDPDPQKILNITTVGMLLPVAPNSTSTTGKPSTKDAVEKCPQGSLLPCVTKCCPYGQSLVGEICRKSLIRFIPQFTLLVNGFNDTKPENETEKMAKYNLIEQNICAKDRYRLEPFNDSADEFHLLVNGSLWLPATKPHHTMLDSHQYCMEVFVLDGEEVMLPLVCFSNANTIVESSFHFMVYPIGLLISVPFLLATFIVYNMIPELRNLHGKALSCYVLCLMLAYIFLAVVQLGGQGFDTHVCVGVAFAIQFSFIACFFWLNVLCFDTWRNVFVHGDLGYTMEKSQERSFFIFYSIYAWSFTIVLIIVTMVMNFTPTIPSSYLKPGIGEKTCWFNTEREAFPYFYGPVGVLIIINVILFIMTAFKLILEHHKEAICVRTAMQTFQLCLTLFFIMGINWVMEIISWAAGGPPFIWYITDICNTLQGIFIFVVFVMDERVRGLCKTELFPRLQEFFAACCPQRRTRRASTEPHYDSINGQEMVYMFKKDDIEQ